MPRRPPLPKGAATLEPFLNALQRGNQKQARRSTKPISGSQELDHHQPRDKVMKTNTKAKRNSKKQTSQQLITKYAEQINLSWKKAVPSILAMAEACREMDAKPARSKDL